MSVDAAMPLTRPGRGAAYLDWLQMLTGAALILFMWAHMLLVSSVLVAKSAMNAIAAFFEYTGMAQVGGPLIGILFLLHFLLAARKVPFRTEQQMTMLGHARMLHHADTWLWVVQAVSAMVILVLGAVHMWTVLTNLPITAVRSAARVQQWPWALLYVVLLPLMELHVSIGFYRIGVKWGLIKRSNRKKYKHIEYILAGAFLVIGTATLIRFLIIDVN